MRDIGSIGTRWLGVGLAACVAVITLGLTITGRLGLYISPDSAWFAGTMAVVALAGVIASFALPLGEESDHDHDHGSDQNAEPDHQDPDHHEPGQTGRNPGSIAATAVGAVAASGIVLIALALPPASLSAELAMSRDVGAPPLFAGQDLVTLAGTGDTASFGVGEWATVFATATNPDAFDGSPIELTGFVTPSDVGADFDLTRLVITHCVIDAQTASLPVAARTSVPSTGQWVTITGTVRATSDGRLEIDARIVEEIAEPDDPYEF